MSSKLNHTAVVGIAPVRVSEGVGRCPRSMDPCCKSVPTDPRTDGFQLACRAHGASVGAPHTVAAVLTTV